MNYSKMTKDQLAAELASRDAENAELIKYVDEAKKAERHYKELIEQSLNGSDVYVRAVHCFGENSRLLLTIEEMSELAKELLKRTRGRKNLPAISEEMADVEIMLEQLKIVFCNRSEVECAKSAKLQRLADKLDGNGD